MTDISKNATEFIRILESEFKGREYIDVRVWLKSDAPSDEPTPTKKGLAFGRDQLPDIIRALSDLQHHGDGEARRNAPGTGKAYRDCNRKFRRPHETTTERRDEGNVLLHALSACYHYRHDEQRPT